MLRGLPDCDVRVWSEELRKQYGSPGHAGASIVLSDAQTAARLLSDSESTPPPIVLVGGGSTEGGAAVSNRAAARLCIDADRESVIHTVRRLGARVRGREMERNTVQISSTAVGKPDSPRLSRSNGEYDRSEGPPRGGLAPGALRRVCEHIEQHLSEKVGHAELAAIAGLSGSHFSRAFKESVGVPPHRYLSWRRVDAAAKLIRDTARPLAEISCAVGFSDQSHFSRTFTRLIGETPGAFRRRHR